MEKIKLQDKLYSVSVVILTWNSEKYIEKCLSSMLDALSAFQGDYEIFIVDNGSTDQSVPILKTYQKKYPDTVFPIFLTRNQGTTKSRNLALRRAKGEVIIVADSDIVVPADALPHLLAILRESDNTGMVVPRLVYGDGRFQKSTDSFPTLLSKLYRYFFLKKIEDQESVSQHMENRPVDYAISALWLMKKEVLERVGLLDERIFYAPEDVDYCLRVWKVGFRILYVPACTIIHDAQEISRGFRINKAFFEHLKGLVYYFFKHGYLLRKPCFHNCHNN